MVSFQQLTTDSFNILVSTRITPQLLHLLINNNLQGNVQDSLNDILSKINLTTASTTAYETQIPRDWIGLPI